MITADTGDSKQLASNPSYISNLYIFVIFYIFICMIIGDILEGLGPAGISLAYSSKLPQKLLWKPELVYFCLFVIPLYLFWFCSFQAVTGEGLILAWCVCHSILPQLHFFSHSFIPMIFTMIWQLWGDTSGYRYIFPYHFHILSHAFSYLFLSFISF